MGEKRMVAVATVQMESRAGDIEGNLERAEERVSEAVEGGAERVLLPEFLPSGYLFERRAWESAEPTYGPTTRWLARTATEKGIYLGTSYLEADGSNFFNTFVLYSPDGEELGRIRKQTPALVEAFFTKGESGPHVIDCDLGRIGVGICMETQRSFLLPLLHAAKVDLALLPHSAPNPDPSPMAPRQLREALHDRVGTIAEHAAKLLGVPAIMANKCGEWRTGLLDVPGFHISGRFLGFSAIVEAGGRVIEKLGDEPGVIVAEVTLDPSLRAEEPPKTYGHWSYPAPAIYRAVPLLESTGAHTYSLDPLRRRAARRISRGG